MSKALVLKTGEILDINKMYKQFKMSMTINLVDKKDIDTPSKSKRGDGKIVYLLSDGSQYDQMDLIVGEDNIRDYKIKNIID